MDGLIELIFERVPDGAVDELVKDRLVRGGICELAHSELGSLDPKKVGLNLISLLEREDVPSSIFLRVGIVMIGDVPIRNPLIRILRFERCNEVMVVFNSIDIDATDRRCIVTRLAAGAKVLADALDVPDYCCGFEPATDEKTRLFSRDKIGPLLSL